MKKITITLSDKLFNKLEIIRNNLSNKEGEFVSFDDMIEEAIMEHYNIKISEINDEISDTIIVNTIEKTNNLNNYYVYIYYNDRNRTFINVGDYYFYSEPIYVGKGRGNRMYEMNNRNQNLVELINDLKTTDSFTMHKLITNLNERDAYYYEQLFINAFGTLNSGTGSLYNVKSGVSKKNTINSSNIGNLNLEYQLIKLILVSLNKTNNISKTSKELNINLRTLYRKIKKYSIVKVDDEWILKNNT